MYKLYFVQIVFFLVYSVHVKCNLNYREIIRSFSNLFSMCQRSIMSLDNYPRDSAFGADVALYL